MTGFPAGVQTQCPLQPTTGLVDCGGWSVSASWAIPPDAVSGVYFAHLVGNDGGESHIVFVVRNDRSRSDIYYQTSDTTWQAYNDYGGNSLYEGGPLTGGNTPRASKVSYNRPFVTRGVQGGQDWIFNAEVPMIRWLERNGYDVSYETGVDTDRYGSLIKNHKIFMSSGHDEYWSGPQRANVTSARDAGVNLAFFSGNEVFWKTRWEDNYRTLVSYKETHDRTPTWTRSGQWTGTFMDAAVVQPRRAASAERPHGHPLLGRPRAPGPSRSPPASTTCPSGVTRGPGHLAARGDAGLRVGLRHEQRLPPARAGGPLLDHRHRDERRARPGR